MQGGLVKTSLVNVMPQKQEVLEIGHQLSIIYCKVVSSRLSWLLVHQYKKQFLLSYWFGKLGPSEGSECYQTDPR